MLDRRQFILLAAAAALAPNTLASSEAPHMLDHILLGSNDLNAGINFIEEHTGVRAAIGGVHPGRGTRNALLSLGERRYLEIIAPDPAQSKIADVGLALFNTLKSLTVPTLVGWAAHPGDIDMFAKKLRAASIEFDGPREGSRARPDGRVLKWKTVSLADDHNGVLPFFIEWDANSVHPSVDAPSGCLLESFAIVDPDPAGLKKVTERIGLDVPIEPGAKAHLHARFAPPERVFDVSS
jgi:glyoxalase-like protein